MTSAAPAVLCVYRYDAMDRLADCSVAGRDSVHCFYQKNLLSTQIQGQVQYTLLRTDEYLLAQQSLEDNQTVSTLPVTDQQQSMVATPGLALSYTAYGYRQPLVDPMNLPGFTGQRVDPVTGHYLLGNGYRAFNPVLMRFNRPDSLSPFGEGGLNAYAYCGGDPVNRNDPSGHIGVLWTLVKRSLSRIVNMEKTLPVKNFGLFGSLVEQRPHIFESIVKFLPGESLVSLASTSRAMKSAVYSVSSKNFIAETSIIGIDKLNLRQISKGEASGLLPLHGNIVNTYANAKQSVSVFVAAKVTKRSLGPAAEIRGLGIRRGAFSE